MGTILPFSLPDCPNPATVRLEAYSPADGRLHGSLDASAYACDAHAIEAVETIQAARLSVHRVPMAPDTTRTCGHVYLFPTGAFGDNPHPSWCDLQDCDRRGEHSTGPIAIDTNRPEATIIELAMIQALDDGAAPQVVLTGASGSEPTAVRLPMSVSQGYVLSNRMRLLTEAQRRRNGGLR